MAAEMSSYFGNTAVNYCYNPTSMSSVTDNMGYVKDLSQCTTQYLGKITSEVTELASHLKSLCTTIGSRGRVVHIAHSQGALITYLAARQLTPAECSKIEIICFGGAKAICGAEFPHFKRRVNYYSVNDPLLHVCTRAAKALTTGLLYGPGQNEEPEFVFLSPKGNDPIIDHGLLGPTYKDVMMWEGRRYQMLYSGFRSSRWFKELERTQERVDMVMRKIIATLLVPLLVKLMELWAAVRSEWEKQRCCLGLVRLMVGRARVEGVEQQIAGAAQAAEKGMAASYATMVSVGFLIDKLTA